MNYSRTQFARAYIKLANKYSAHELARGFANIFQHNSGKQDLDAFGEDITRMWADAHDTAIVTITSARELSLSARKRISNYIMTQEGKKNLSATYMLDSALIGGAIVQTPTHRYTFSVHGILTQLL